MLLSLRGPLELTADQVKQLEGMQAAPRGQRNGSDALRARADMMDAMRGDGDLTKARAALDKMSRGRNDAVIARLKERQDVRNVLTTAQKAKLDNMRGNRRGMMRGRMRQGMRQGMEARMRMQRGPGMGQGFRSGGRQGMGGGNAPRGRDMEREVFIERRPPVPPLDSLDIR